MRLTKFNPETGQYVTIETPKTFSQLMAQRKSVIQKLGMLEDAQDAQIWEDRLCEALRNIVWYDGHSEWLEELCKEIEKAKEEGQSYPNPLDVKEWHTEKHSIWMMLVSMFGDWGTSIRSGWIEKHNECIKFIKGIMPAEEEDDEQIY